MLHALLHLQNFASLACFYASILRENPDDSDPSAWCTTLDFSGFLEALCRLSDSLKHPYIFPPLAQSGPLSRAADGELRCLELYRGYCNGWHDCSPTM